MAYSVQARTNMIENQLRPSGVTSAHILEVIAEIPRDEFVPETLREAAYLDEDVPLSDNRFLMEPRVFGRLLEAADIKPTDKVLDIACGTGYSSAVLSRLAKSVVAVESVGELAETARRNLRQLKSDAQLFCASLSGGYSLQAPYDVIFINGGVEQVPQELFEQLAQGGRIMAVRLNPDYRLTGHAGLGQAMCWTRIGDNVHEKRLFEASVPVLSDFENKAEFTF